MYTLTLASVPNPDFGETRRRAPSVTMRRPTLRECREAVRQYSDGYDLGGGNWARECGRVTRSGRLVGRFSYNLRFWRKGGRYAV